MLTESIRDQLEPTANLDNVVSDHDKQCIIFDTSKSRDMNVYSSANMVISPVMVFDISTSSDHVENVLHSNHPSSVSNDIPSELYQIATRLQNTIVRR